MFEKIRNWVIIKLIGNKPVIANCFTEKKINFDLRYTRHAILLNNKIALTVKDVHLILSATKEPNNIWIWINKKNSSKKRN